ncbi:MAG: VOC family protein [Miltoncostaeaceae bacterium]
MSHQGLHIDHVIYGVVDIDAAAERLRRDHGLGSLPSGVLGGGTTNRMVPLEPPAFLELLGVADPEQPDGAWLSQTLGGEDRVLWWCLGVDDIDAAADRCGIPVQGGQMPMVDGPPRFFRTAGMPQYPFPFFISFDMDAEERLDLRRAQYREAAHDCEPGGYTYVEVGDTPEMLASRLGEHDLPVQHVPGAPVGIRACGIATDRGEIELR